MNRFRHFALALTLLVPLSFAPGALAQSALPGIGAVEFDEGSSTLTLAVPYHSRNPYRVLWLNAPQRLVVDIEGLRIVGKRNMFIGSGVVTRIRAARFNANTTRVVFDLAQPADLTTVTDGASGRLVLAVFPRGAASRLAADPGPAAVPTPPPSVATPAPFPATPPQPRITPVPLFTPPPAIEPTPVPAETPTPEPTFVPPPPTPDPMEPTEPIADPFAQEPPAVVEEEFQVFGSRLTLGAELPLSVAENYPDGNSQTTVPGPLLGGLLSWDQMFTPNFGISVDVRGQSYTIEDDVAKTAGVTVAHKRDDYEGQFGIRGRFGLGGGLELMAEPGFMVRAVMVNNTLDGAPTVADEYLYSPWLGYGPTLGAGVGWHVFGPFSLAATADMNYLMGGTMLLPSVPPNFPMLGIRAGGEARFDFGFLGVAAGYNLTTYSYSGGSATNTLSQSWSGPYLKTSIVY